MILGITLGAVLKLMFAAFVVGLGAGGFLAAWMGRR